MRVPDMLTIKKTKAAILGITYLLSFSLPSMADEILVLSTGEKTESFEIPTANQHIEATDNSVIVTYDIDGISIKESEEYPGRYIFKLQNFGINETEGELAYIMRSDRFQVPIGKGVKMTVTECKYKEFPYRLAPAATPEYDGVAGINENADALMGGIINPLTSTFASLGNYEFYRNQPLQYVNVCPVQYDRSRQSIKIIERLQYKLEFTSQLNDIPIKSNLAVFDDPFISGACLNSTVTEAAVQPLQAESLVKDYLIVTTSKFEKEAKRFAKWKKLMGYNSHVESHENWESADEVKRAIEEYASKHSNFYYLLLVGDAEDIPFATTGSTPWNTTANPLRYISDYEYACVDGDSQFDVYLGRISVSSEEEAKTVFDKIISYEKNPPIESYYYNNGLHASYFQIDKPNLEKEVRCFIPTSESIKKLMEGIGKQIYRAYYALPESNPTYLGNGDLVPDELRKPNFGWMGEKDDIIKNINSGVFYVFHRDHGVPSGWVQPNFTSEDISKLKNKLLPVIFSIDCETGKFDDKVCFAEKFLRQKDGGCHAIFAATALSPSSTNNIFSELMFKSIVNSQIESYSRYSGSKLSLGELLNCSLSNLITVGGDNLYTRLERHIYHCFGDPSMLFLTGRPYSVSDVKIIQKDLSIEISCEDSDAIIVVYDEITDSVTHYTNGNVLLPLDEGQNYSISVIGKGMRPVVYENCAAKTLYIQNEAIENSRTYEIENIVIGGNVSTAWPNGKVEILSGSLNLKGKISLLNNVNINKGVKLNMMPTFK